AALESRREKKERQAIEQQVAEIAVDEATGDDGVVLALAQQPVRPQQVSLQDRGRNPQRQRAHEQDGAEDQDRSRSAIEVHRSGRRLRESAILEPLREAL